MILKTHFYKSEKIPTARFLIKFVKKQFYIIK